ncbi:bacteriohemerythrin [Carboxylicivirga sp. N1Y90]|uniref:bacteriohemerythrin n=1 Tax=Carboxylicivirga fragile TaxID=3417571 RepID=UPI003D332394|nr:hemerythrin family protein [Marinilabiliaceae bacterium N1Y90]
MTLIRWQSAFSVNVKEIDDQHKHLVNLLNRLHDDLISNNNADVGEVVNELIDYTLIHFKTEEKYLKQHNYPNRRIHQEEHEAFAKKMLDFKKEFEAGKIGLSVELLDYLRDWLTDHIMGSDQSYAAFLMENRIN